MLKYVNIQWCKNKRRKINNYIFLTFNKYSRDKSNLTV